MKPAGYWLEHQAESRDYAQQEVYKAYVGWEYHFSFVLRTQFGLTLLAFAVSTHSVSWPVEEFLQQYTKTDTPGIQLFERP